MSRYNNPADENPPEETGFVHLDFEQTFPHIFWTSDWGTHPLYPDGFRYKIFSIRQEPKGDFEVVLVHEARNGHKTEMQRWSVPSESIDATDDLVHSLEAEFSIKFDRVDMTDIQTFDSFEARVTEIGWEVL